MCVKEHFKRRSALLRNVCSAALAHVRRVVQSLEAALNGGGQQQEGVRRQRVLTAHLVRGTPFYGFHPGERLFIKIIMYACPPACCFMYTFL